MKGVSYDHKQILENKLEKSDIIFYLKNFGPLFLVQFVFLGYMIVRIATGSADPLLGLFFIAFVLVVIFGCIGYLVYKRLSVNRGMKEDIEHIGLSNLLMDLNDPENEVFYLHPDRYETYTVISSRYIYFSKEAVYPVNEIKKIYIDVHDMSCQIKAGGTPHDTFDPKSDNPRNLIKFCKPAYITTKDGKTERKLISLYPEDMDTVNEIFRSVTEENSRF